MKSTKWIKEKKADIEKQIAYLDNQIRERGFSDNQKALNKEFFIYKNGNQSKMTLNEMSIALSAKHVLLTEILNN